MDKKKILFIERSHIIRQGMTDILRSQSFKYEIICIADSLKVQECVRKHCPLILMVNPSDFLDNNGERLKILRQDAINFGFKLVAFVYAYFDEQILSLFDEVVYINDDDEKILSKINELANFVAVKNNQEENATLSQRELDVIRLIALGYSNREIAEELYISIHTVISHRKNITGKLGVKSASGLTIYAVINKLISSTDFDKTV